MNGNVQNNVEITGTTLSEEFSQNTSSETIIRTITFNYQGLTAETTITQDILQNTLPDYSIAYYGDEISTYNINNIEPLSIEGSPGYLVGHTVFQKNGKYIEKLIIGTNVTNIGKNVFDAGNTNNSMNGLKDLIILGNIDNYSMIPDNYPYYYNFSTIFTGLKVDNLYLSKNFKSRGNLFYGSSTIGNIYYEGSEEEWNSNITSIHTDENSTFKIPTNTIIHYNTDFTQFNR